MTKFSKDIFVDVSKASTLVELDELEAQFLNASAKKKKEIDFLSEKVLQTKKLEMDYYQSLKAKREDSSKTEEEKITGAKEEEDFLLELSHLIVDLFNGNKARKGLVEKLPRLIKKLFSFKPEKD